MYTVFLKQKVFTQEDDTTTEEVTTRVFCCEIPLRWANWGFLGLGSQHVFPGADAESATSKGSLCISRNVSAAKFGDYYEP